MCLASARKSIRPVKNYQTMQYQVIFDQNSRTRYKEVLHLLTPSLRELTRFQGRNIFFNHLDHHHLVDMMHVNHNLQNKQKLMTQSQENELRDKNNLGTGP